jgi:hypothetical protein
VAWYLYFSFSSTIIFLSIRIFGVFVTPFPSMAIDVLNKSVKIIFFLFDFLGALCVYCVLISHFFFLILHLGVTMTQAALPYFLEQSVYVLRIFCRVIYRWSLSVLDPFGIVGICKSI